MLKHWFFCAIFAVTPAASGAKQPQQVPAFYAAAAPGQRLTPPVALAPQLNAPELIAVVAGKPFVHRIAISGVRPMHIELENLPQGLHFDADNAVIRGVVQAQQGDISVRLKARNAAGSCEGILKLRIGTLPALTPPMGWNSWYCHSELVSEQAVQEAAKHLLSSGLADFGWSYVNIDDCWQGCRGGELNALQANSRFGNMRAMCEQLHAQGLKAGIYGTPWISSYAGFQGSSSNFAHGDDSTLGLCFSQRLQPTQYFGRWPSLHKLKLDRVGEYDFLANDIRQWAEWGFDYVKMDWHPNDPATCKKIQALLQNSPRAMFLAISNNAALQHGKQLLEHANAVRTSGDIKDSWESVSSIGFAQQPWQELMQPGHWPDPDMLQIGKIAKPNNLNKHFVATRLTPDEQYTQMSLWCLLSAPLLLSCDLSQLDDFSLGLLCNARVLAVNQDIKAAPARCVWSGEGIQLWCKSLQDGALVVGIFNTADHKQVYKPALQQLPLNGRKLVTDLWRQKQLGVLRDDWQIEVNPHGVVLLEIR